MAYTTIKKPSDYFNTKLWTGDGTSSRSLTGVNFQPDWTWIKRRSDAQAHSITDSVRGVTKSLRSDTTDAEDTNNANGYITSFDSDGFTVAKGSDPSRTNTSSATYVAWNWKAGTSFTNDASATGIGSIDSTGSVNTDAGFSITKFTADGNNLTAAHGLGVAPTMILTKNLSITKDWSVYHHSLGAGKSIFLNTTAAADTDNTYWNNTAPTSTTLSYGTWSGNNNGNEIIAYCFAEKQGFSKFGSYVGNGSADGTFIYTGFKPAFILSKDADAAENWFIQDTTRNTSNPVGAYLRPNLSDAEGTFNHYDILSNGFKNLYAGGSLNTSGRNIIYMAFAEQPLVGDNPATAR